MDTAQLVLGSQAKQTQLTVTQPIMIAGVVAVIAIIALLLLKRK